jgi:hypothetical protein
MIAGKGKMVPGVQPAMVRAAKFGEGSTIDHVFAPDRMMGSAAR